MVNRDEDFPDWRGRDLHSRYPDTAVALLAADGATTGTLLDHQLPRVAALAFRPTLVTLTIGGNDLLGAYGSTSAAGAVIARVETAVDRALTVLADLVDPAARTAVGTVYDPSDGTGDTAVMGLPPWPDGVAMIEELNAALRQVAARHGAVVADIAEVFHGHGVLAGNPAQVAARPVERDLWFCNVIEPNAWGASGVREAFWRALGV